MEVMTQTLKERTRRVLGSPVRQLELTDEHLDDAFEIACENWDMYSMLSPLTAAKKKSIKNTWIKSYMLATCKEMLGRIQGKFSGSVNTGSHELKIDYKPLLREASDEKYNLKIILGC